jgi:hypothetical protein
LRENELLLCLFLFLAGVRICCGIRRLICGGLRQFVVYYGGDVVVRFWRLEVVVVVLVVESGEYWWSGGGFVVKSLLAW